MALTDTLRKATRGYGARKPGKKIRPSGLQRASDKARVAQSRDPGDARKIPAGGIQKRSSSGPVPMGTLSADGAGWTSRKGFGGIGAAPGGSYAQTAATYAQVPASGTPGTPVEQVYGTVDKSLRERVPVDLTSSSVERWPASRSSGLSRVLSRAARRRNSKY